MKMARVYDHEQVEKKWQQRWEESGINKAKDGGSKPKFYGLVEFPYRREPVCM
jgi:Leucyl-tRNA synthetase